MFNSEAVEYVRNSIYNASGRKIGNGVIKELLTLAGGDCEIVINSSIKAEGLDQCRARIINERFNQLFDIDEED